jgi:hypothetical protein
MQTAIDEAEILIREPADVYHAQANKFLSSHQLADFRKCPQLYYQKKLGIVRDEDRPAYLLGRAVHALALEGREPFDSEYAVGGPLNPKTGAPFGAGTKAFAEWAARHGKQVLTESQYALVSFMAASVRAHELAGKLLAEGLAEGVVRADYCGTPCQIRMDWFDPHQGIVDLKTCDDLTWFEADARRFGYGHQVAFYRAVLAQVIGVAMPAYFIAVEKKEPYRTGVWKVTDDTLTAAQRENESAIERLRRCEETGDWPTGYEECRSFDYV